MHFLSHYLDKARAEALSAHGAFFAFNDTQFKNEADPDLDYTTLLGAGLFVPRGETKSLVAALETVHKAGIAQDLAENGKTGVIRRELMNYECHFAGIRDVVWALTPYGITRDEIAAEYPAFYQECIDNDRF